MLTSESYWLALACYGLSALLGLVLIYRFWLQRLAPIWRRALTGLLAAWLLTPVSPGPEATTLAPALIVALFNAAFVDGWAAARQAVLVLVATSVVGVLCGMASLLLPTARAGTGPVADASEGP